MDPIAKFWDALRALTYIEMQDVACTMRDAYGSSEYDPNDAVSWMELLNSGRMIYEDREDDAEAEAV